jgi:hypothetical protein
MIERVSTCILLVILGFITGVWLSVESQLAEAERGWASIGGKIYVLRLAQPSETETTP